MTVFQSQQVSVTPVPSSTHMPQPGNSAKAPFIPPKLTFVAPKLTKQGSVEKLTAGLIGTFS